MSDTPNQEQTQLIGDKQNQNIFLQINKKKTEHFGYCSFLKYPCTDKECQQESKRIQNDLHKHRKNSQTSISDEENPKTENNKQLIKLSLEECCVNIFALRKFIRKNSQRLVDISIKKCTFYFSDKVTTNNKDTQHNNKDSQNNNDANNNQDAQNIEDVQNKQDENNNKDTKNNKDVKNNQDKKQSKNENNRRMLQEIDFTWLIQTFKFPKIEKIEIVLLEDEEKIPDDTNQKSDKQQEEGLKNKQIQEQKTKKSINKNNAQVQDENYKNKETQDKNMVNDLPENSTQVQEVNAKQKEKQEIMKMMGCDISETEKGFMNNFQCCKDSEFIKYEMNEKKEFEEKFSEDKMKNFINKLIWRDINENEVIPYICTQIISEIQENLQMFKKYNKFAFDNNDVLIISNNVLNNIISRTQLYNLILLRSKEIKVVIFKDNGKITPQVFSNLLNLLLQVTSLELVSFLTSTLPDKESLRELKYLIYMKHVKYLVLYRSYFDEDEIKKLLDLEDYTTNIEKNSIATKIEPKIETKIEPKIETKVETKIEPKIETKIEPKIEPKIETKVETKSDTKIDHSMFTLIKLDNKKSKFYKFTPVLNIKEFEIEQMLFENQDIQFKNRIQLFQDKNLVTVNKNQSLKLLQKYWNFHFLKDKKQELNQQQLLGDLEKQFNEDDINIFNYYLVQDLIDKIEEEKYKKQFESELKESKSYKNIKPYLDQKIEQAQTYPKEKIVLKLYSYFMGLPLPIFDDKDVKIIIQYLQPSSPQNPDSQEFFMSFQNFMDDYLGLIQTQNKEIDYFSNFLKLEDILKLLKSDITGNRTSKDTSKNKENKNEQEKKDENDYKYIWDQNLYHYKQEKDSNNKENKPQEQQVNDSLNKTQDPQQDQNSQNSQMSHILLYNWIKSPLFILSPYYLQWHSTTTKGIFQGKNEMKDISFYKDYLTKLDGLDLYKDTKYIVCYDKFFFNDYQNFYLKNNNNIYDLQQLKIIKENMDKKNISKAYITYNLQLDSTILKNNKYTEFEMIQLVNSIPPSEITIEGLSVQFIKSWYAINYFSPLSTSTKIKIDYNSLENTSISNLLVLKSQRLITSNFDKKSCSSFLKRLLGIMGIKFFKMFKSEPSKYKFDDTVRNLENQIQNSFAQKKHYYLRMLYPLYIFVCLFGVWFLSLHFEVSCGNGISWYSYIFYAVFGVITFFIELFIFRESLKKISHLIPELKPDCQISFPHPQINLIKTLIMEITWINQWFMSYLSSFILSQIARFDFFTDIGFLYNTYSCDQMTIFYLSLASLITTNIFSIGFFISSMLIEDTKNNLVTKHIDKLYQLCNILEFQAAAEVLDIISPSNCIIVFGQMFNQRIVNHFTRILFEDLPQILIQVYYVVNKGNFNSSVFFSLITSIFMLIISLYKLFSISPSQISLEDFNQLNKNKKEKLPEYRKKLHEYESKLLRYNLYEILKCIKSTKYLAYSSLWNKEQNKLTQDKSTQDDFNKVQLVLEQIDLAVKLRDDQEIQNSLKKFFGTQDDKSNGKKDDKSDGIEYNDIPIFASGSPIQELFKLEQKKKPKQKQSIDQTN